MANSLDLTRLLPSRYRDKTLDALLKNLFNRHLSKEDTAPLYGFIGDTTDLQPGEVRVEERSIERQLNQLTTLIYAEHGSEKKIYSWPDLVQKMVLLGVDQSRVGKIFRTKSYNFVPPIDLDKFCNFQEYVWIGDWVKTVPGLPYWKLGVPSSNALSRAFEDSNSRYSPEYYVIGRGDLDEDGEALQIAPNVVGWSSWSLVNLWVHIEDAASFLKAHGGLIGFEGLVQATRPILEYSRNLRLNTFQSELGEPADSGVYRVPPKLRVNQPPMFDLYRRDGSHLGVTSSIFYYSPDQEAPVDSVLGQRAALDQQGNYVFEHSLVNSDGELRFFKEFEPSGKSALRTIWAPGPIVGPNYSRFNTSGSLISSDKFNNFKNYYWTGVGAVDLPAYNPLGEPEYVVIEKGGESGWSSDNRWEHVNNLKRSELSSYVQASRPIIEFNVLLESELTSSKISIHQLPTFALYRFDEKSKTYELLGTGDEERDVNFNDAYSQGTLFTRLDDLPEVKQAVVSTSEIFSGCVDHLGNKYLQSLVSGAFVTERGGSTSPYYASIASVPSSEANGSMSVASVAEECVPEVLILTWNGSSFDVRGTASGAQPPAGFGEYVSSSGVTVTISQGTKPFSVGDAFAIEIKTLLYERRNAFVKVDGAYRTISTPEEIVTGGAVVEVVDADPQAQNGAWIVPPQIEWNPHNETRAKISHGDLYHHFAKIIESQPGIVGSSAGKNNWRLLPEKDVGLGGLIKQHDGDVQILVSMLLQEGVSPLTLLDFARESYDLLESEIRTFVEVEVPNLLSSGDVSLTGKDLAKRFKDYFKNQSPVVSATETTADDFLAAPFYDSTSSIQNLVATLPYLGLSEKVQPRREVDLELNLPVLVHHDGHRSVAQPSSPDVMKKIVTREFARSSGRSTPGHVSGSSYPSAPYRNQFWFKTSTGELFYYNIVSDNGEQPGDVPFGSYSVDRSTGKIYQFNGIWNLLSEADAQHAPWTKFDPSEVIQDLLLEIETELYEKCPPLSPLLDSDSLAADPLYSAFMKKELERFGATYGTTDVYSSTYDPLDPFTWNYSGASAIGASSQKATWQEIYRDVYGTPRPDLEPWVPAGYADEDRMIEDLVANGVVDPGIDAWSTDLWQQSALFLSQKYSNNGAPAQLSVDTDTGELIPPHSFGHPQEIVGSVPETASSAFSFGDLGPVELYWTKTQNYLYSQQKAFFKIDPLSYVSSTWGLKNVDVGGCSIDARLGQKERPAIAQLHGDSFDELAQQSWFSVELVAVPDVATSYTFQCVSRIDNIFIVTRDGEVAGFASDEYEDDLISARFSPSLRGFFWGDTYSVEINALGHVTAVLSPATHLRAEGINQLLVQYYRVYGQDVQTSLNMSLFKGWTAKMGYRFGGLISTDRLEFKAEDVIDQSAYEVHLKENKFYNSSWINALRVQLVQRGSTESIRGSSVPRAHPGTGEPGTDWVFRIDNFNPRRTEIVWNVLADNPAPFVALGGQKTSWEWSKFSKTGQTKSHSTPFLVTGIQNLVNFVLGYASYLEDQGWRFNEPGATVDAETHRTVDYQFLIEKFIDQLFSGVAVGAAFTFAPFSRKVWYEASHGTVSDLYDAIGFEQETVCSVLDSRGRHVPKSAVRVFRQDDVTQIVSDVPLHTLHLLTSEYEHVALFEPTSVDNLVIYDWFLGQKISRLFVNGMRQEEFTGRLDLGGHFLLGGKMKRNIESTIDGVLKLYDLSEHQPNSPEAERARALLGFQKKDYFEERGTPDQTEFRFWQGMIANKGTNFAIDAYLNSAKYKSSMLDEFWAYKVAEYGDSGERSKPEIKVFHEDGITDFTNFLFLEENDPAAEGVVGSGAYDMAPYDTSPYNEDAIFAEDTFYEIFDPRGCKAIRPEDESRWFSYSDLNSFTAFDLAVIVEQTVVPENTTDVIQIFNPDGTPARADVYELVDLTLFEEHPVVYHEPGDLVSLDTFEHAPAKFRRVNHSMIIVTDESLVGRSLLVRGYGPAPSRHSPVELHDYRNNVVVKNDVIWWDPARGTHHPLAAATIDYKQSIDPATYNRTVKTGRKSNLERHKPWGSGEVGRVWWNDRHLAYKPYSDSMIVDTLHGRLTQWGAKADYSSLEVYEWVMSDAPPEKYSGEGEVALSRIVKRERTWWHRPVAWKHSESPGLNKRKFLAYQPSWLRIATSNGRGLAVLHTGSFDDIGVKVGTKISGAVYSQIGGKTDTNLDKVFGLAVVTGQSQFVVGTATGFNDGAAFAESSYYTLSIELVQEVISFRSRNLGRYALDHEVDEDISYVKLTHVDSGANQRLEVGDTPVKAETQVTYYFDVLGVKVHAKAIFGRNEEWISGVPTEETRKQFLAEAVGNPEHEIYVRSAVEVLSPISFINDRKAYKTFPDWRDQGHIGWIAWNDPVMNPKDGPPPPFHQYEAVVGEWTKVGGYLPDLVDEITELMGDPWASHDGTSFSPYKFTWSDWVDVEPEMRTAIVDGEGPNLKAFDTEDYDISGYGEASYASILMVDKMTEDEIKARVQVYVNGYFIRFGKWTLEPMGRSFFIMIPDLKIGDTIVVRISPKTPTSTELQFDPDVEDEPFNLVQYKRELPHVEEKTRGELGTLAAPTYYFWVKNKTVPAKGKKISIRRAADLLEKHDDVYAVPQIVKFANQADGRKNRHALLSVVGLGRYARADDTFKLRLTSDPTLRGGSESERLKNVHTEWKLLRPFQPEKIPHELWSLLTDSLVGANTAGQDLPEGPLMRYDDRNGTDQRYGFGDGHLLADPNVAKETVKHVLANPRSAKYVNGEMVPDYVTFPGFSLDKIDDHLSTPEKIRRLMADIWRFAQAKQINEIFFAVLEDAASRNLELTDFFKTSFISLSEVRTLT